MADKSISMRIGGIDIGDAHTVRVMGVLNVSEESFYEASYVRRDEISACARRMIESGADCLDVGGRSTAPRSKAISVEEELRRVRDAVDLLFGEVDTSKCLVSIDTQYRHVAEAAFGIFERHNRADAFLLNDVSNLRTDPALGTWICEVDRPVILMASNQRPGDSPCVSEAVANLIQSIEMLDRQGMRTVDRVIVDPAIGKWTGGRSAADDTAIIKRLHDFRALGHPILVGISRKSFIGELLGQKDPGDRFYGTLSATAVAVYNGAHIVRTHDVDNRTLDAVRIASAIRNA